MGRWPARIAKWAGIVVGGLVALVALGIAVGAVVDRPRADPIPLDRGAPTVAAFFEAEAALLDDLGLEYEEHYVEVEQPSLRVRVLEVGQGPPVVVVPGGVGMAADMASLLAEIDGYRFLALDRPGGGGSDTIDHRAVDMRALIGTTLDAVHDYFDLEAVPIVGNSMGGGWALWYGLDRPERVTAMMLIGTPALVEGTTVPGPTWVPGSPGLSWLFAKVTVARSPEAARNVLSVWGHPPEVAESWPEAEARLMYASHHRPHYQLAWRSLLQASLGVDGFESDVVITTEKLAELDLPVLLIWGSGDTFGSTEVARTVAGALPDAELEIVGIGHKPWLDEPDRVAGLLDEFLGTAP